MHALGDLPGEGEELSSGEAVLGESFGLARGDILALHGEGVVMTTRTQVMAQRPVFTVLHNNIQGLW